MHELSFMSVPLYCVEKALLCMSLDFPMSKKKKEQNIFGSLIRLYNFLDYTYASVLIYFPCVVCNEKLSNRQNFTSPIEIERLLKYEGLEVKWMMRVGKLTT